eukprot:Skav225099  [mRNA]  locus=scaffold621:537799:553336:- [translate_table: standard]
MLWLSDACFLLPNRCVGFMELWTFLLASILRVCANWLAKVCAVVSEWKSSRAMPPDLLPRVIADSCDAVLIQLQSVPASSLRSNRSSAPSETDAQALRHPFRRSSSVGNIRILYHQTSTTAGPLILHGSFRRGHSGWPRSLTDASAKQKKGVAHTGADSHQGFIIEAIVDLGVTKYLPYYCTSSPECWGGFHYDCVDHTFEGDRFQSDGYDSAPRR